MIMSRSIMGRNGSDHLHVVKRMDVDAETS